MQSTLTTVVSALLFGSSITNAAKATFGKGTDIKGSVTVEAGEIIVDLDLSTFNTSLFPNGTSCFKNGFKYHIHEKWTYNSSSDKLAGDCGSDYTGGHWDPWTACSTSTGSIYCKTSGTTNNVTGCLPGSVSWQSGRLNYSCDSTNYTESPYVCEVGDWSGKYGVLDVNNLQMSNTASSAFEVDGTDLDGKSIVFHCTDDAATRAFCAPFEDTNSDTSSSRVTQSSSESKRATFSELENSYIELLNTNRYKVEFDISNLEIPDECGTLQYRVYTASPSSAVIVNGTRRRLQVGPPNGNNTGNSTATTSSPINQTAVIIETTLAPIDTTQSSPETTSSSSSLNCSSLVNSFYDPTVSCAVGSQYENRYCARDVLKCGDDTYDYVCNTTSDKYSCAPGDLSGKYGLLDTQNGTVSTFSFDGFDELMISLDDIEGLYVVLQCSYDPDTILTCAEFEDYSSGGSSSKNNNNGGVAWWVILIIVIGAIALIGGVVYMVRYCKNTEGGSYSQIDGKVQENK